MNDAPLSFFVVRAKMQPEEKERRTRALSDGLTRDWRKNYARGDETPNENAPLAIYQLLFIRRKVLSLLPLSMRAIACSITLACAV